VAVISFGASVLSRFNGCGEPPLKTKRGGTKTANRGCEKGSLRAPCLRVERRRESREADRSRREREKTKLLGLLRGVE